MQISDIDIKLADAPNGKLRAYASFVLGGAFKVKNVRIIEIGCGRFIVSMPGLPFRERCLDCGRGNPVLAKYCSNCGMPLLAPPPEVARRPSYDVFHPINEEARHQVDCAIMDAYRRACRENDRRSGPFGQEGTGDAREGLPQVGGVRTHEASRRRS